MILSRVISDTHFVIPKMADYFEEMGVTTVDDEAPDPLVHYSRFIRDFGMYPILMEEKCFPPPVSKHFYKKLKKETVEAKEINCPICLREPEIGDILIVLPCDHKYHPDCISPWFERTSTCPVCRLEMPTDDQLYEMFKKERLQAKKKEEELQKIRSMFL